MLWEGRDHYVAAEVEAERRLLESYSARNALREFTRVAAKFDHRLEASFAFPG